MLFIKLKNGLFSTNIEINLGWMLSHAGMHLDRKQKETDIFNLDMESQHF